MYCLETSERLIHLLKKQQWNTIVCTKRINHYIILLNCLLLSTRLKIFRANSRFFTCQLKIFGLFGLAGLHQVQGRTGQCKCRSPESIAIALSQNLERWSCWWKCSTHQQSHLLKFVTVIQFWPEFVTWFYKDGYTPMTRSTPLTRHTRVS